MVLIQSKDLKSGVHVVNSGVALPSASTESARLNFYAVVMPQLLRAFTLQRREPCTCADTVYECIVLHCSHQQYSQFMLLLVAVSYRQVSV